jgi:glycosyltransferase involved in cell wall biosynthesis
MNIKQPKRDVVISSGHKNFHMLFSASELERRGRLSSLICGAYPTNFEQMILNSWPLKNSEKLARFLNRVEKISPELIYQNRLSELTSSLSRFNTKLGLRADVLAVSAFNMYGKKSEKVLEQAAKRGAKIYHYRAGFGQSSIKVAKELGMLTVCDHSIVHPSLLKPLIDSKGVYPQSHPVRPRGFWGAILDDVEAADQVLVNSDFVAETFQFMGFDANRLTVAYQGVEDKFMSRLPSNRNYYSDKAKLPVKFLFAGGIIPRKGMDEISQVLLQQSSHDFELHLAGSLPAESKERYAALLADERVTYHGMLSQLKLAELMSHSDVFLLPSRAEGSARVVFEAMAAGCAVITTANTGSAIQNGEGGWIIPVNNIEALQNVLEEILCCPNIIAEIGKVNRRLIQDKYKQINYGENLEDLYSKILAVGK